jgi:hypothetical protein
VFVQQEFLGFHSKENYKNDLNEKKGHLVPGYASTSLTGHPVCVSFYFNTGDYSEDRNRKKMLFGIKGYPEFARKRKRLFPAIW